ncbi:hypothetical protein [Nocardia sp. NPDC049149]|uniref:hypothetical protein n=1 Tax=Nocardia sp. NPDC049149 TaxID=3364315 RepID=UPI00371926F0
MSNFWDLRCRTCSATCDLDWNNGGDQIQQLIPLLPDIARMRPVENLLSDRRVDFAFPFGLLQFAERHHSHDLTAIDQYGVEHGGCIHHYSCACCKSRMLCQLARGHEGECGPFPGGGES